MVEYKQDSPVIPKIITATKKARLKASMSQFCYNYAQGFQI